MYLFCIDMFKIALNSGKEDFKYGSFQRSIATGCEN